MKKKIIVIVYLLLISLLAYGFFTGTKEYLSGKLQSRLGFGYVKGFILPQNNQKAFEWYSKANEKGHPAGQYNLGLCYLNGVGTEKDNVKATELFKKAAEQGYAGGQLQLAISLLEGGGTSVDYQKAISYLELAAKQNQPGAKEILKQITGAAANKNSTKPDGLPSIEELRSFAEKGDLKTQYNLGSAYLNGWGCNPSPEEGFRWWKKSAEGGFSEGQYGLACLYLAGKGTAVDNKAAVNWLKKAAEQNNAKAQRDLGAFYLGGGAGVVVDIPEGLRLTKLAVGQGDPIAEFNLGYSYMKGKGVEKDEVEGRRLIQSSANKGYSYAQEQILIINKK